MASTARRIAGSVGLGGPWRILFSPARLVEAAALQVGVGDHRHQRVAVQAVPGAAFEVVEAEFFLGTALHLSQMPRGRRPHHQSKFYTACSRTRAGWSPTVFVRELPPRSAEFNAENRLYSFALMVWTSPARHLAQ